MRTISFILFITCLIPFTSFSQEANWAWGKTLGGPGMDHAFDIETDNQGNIYHCGGARAIDYDPGPDSAFLNPVGELYISKLDNDGNFIWLKGFSNVSVYLGDSHLAINKNGNQDMLVYGSFGGQMDADPDPATQYILTGPGMFIVKLDSAGNFLWAKSFVGNLNNVTSAVFDFSGNGDIYATGRTYYWQNDMDPDPVDTFYVQASTFVLKLDSAGDFEWAYGTAVRTNDITTDSTSSIYIAGDYNVTADFDPDTSVVYNLPATTQFSSMTDMFIWKLTSNGQFVWVKSFTSPNINTYPQAIEFDPLGNIYMVGIMRDSVNFDPGLSDFKIVVTSSVSNAGWPFVVKMDVNGNFIWAKVFESHVSSVANAIGIDTYLHTGIFVSGIFSGDIDLDPGAGTFMKNGFYEEIFIVKLDNAGSFVWGGSAGNSTRDIAWDMETDTIGIPIIVGSHYSSIIFGPDTLSNVDVGTGDILIAKIACSTFSSIQVNACNSYTMPGSGNIVLVSGIYKDTLYNMLGCDSIIEIHLTINTVDTSVLQNGLQLIANTGNAAYQWLDCSNGFSLLTGEVNQAYYVGASGSYAVEITEGTCIDTSSCYDILITGVDVFEPLNVDVHPNPAQQEINFKTGDQGKYELSIYDLTGRKIHYQVFSVSINFDTHLLANGMYVYELRNNIDRIKKGRFVKE